MQITTRNLQKSSKGVSFQTSTASRYLCNIDIQTKAFVPAGALAVAAKQINSENPMIFHLAKVTANVAFLLFGDATFFRSSTQPSTTRANEVNTLTNKMTMWHMYCKVRLKWCKWYFSLSLQLEASEMR